MDNDKVNEVLRKYEGLLLARGHLPLRNPPDRPLPAGSFDVALNHAHWMCIQTLGMPADKLEKKMRWLGFIQGVLWVANVQTVEESKQDNRPDAERGA